MKVIVKTNHITKVAINKAVTPGSGLATPLKGQTRQTSEVSTKAKHSLQDSAVSGILV
jgi:hypothetical protein